MKIFLFSLLFLFFYGTMLSQVGINTTTPSPASVLDVNSSSDGTNFGGFMPPRVSPAERDLIPVTASDEGLMVYLIDGNNRCLQLYNATDDLWENVYCMPINLAPVANNVQVTGLLQENQTVTAGYDYFDADGDNEGNSNFIWYSATDGSGSNQTILQTGTNDTFNLTAAHLNLYIAVEVTPVAQTGTSPGNPSISEFSGPITPPIAIASDLFISEYVEGSSSNKVIEVANFTGNTINLGNYKILGYQNGNNNAGYTYTFPNENLPNGDVYVIAHSNFDQLPLADNLYNWQFNGNDVVELQTSSDVRVDIIGVIGNNTNFAIDVTLRKKIGVGPNTTYDSNDYDSFASDTFDGLGDHTF